MTERMAAARQRSAAMLASLALVLVPFTFAARGQEIRRVGPLADPVLDILIAPTTPPAIYVATADGVLQSIDGGRHWRYRSNGLPEPPNVSGLAVDAFDPATVYATTDHNGVFRSDDGGNSWRAMNNGLRQDYLGVFSFAVDPVRPGILYAGTYPALYRSNDGAAHWVDASAGMPPFSWVSALAINPKHPQVLFAVARGETPAAYRSVDGARHWTAIGGRLRGVPTSVAIDPEHPSNVYISTSLGVFRSVDNGSHWRPLTGPSNDIVRLEFVSGRPAKLYAATSFGLAGFVSIDGGTTWTSIRTNPVSRVAVPRVSDPADPDTFYAASPLGGIAKSEDGGSSWRLFNNGMAGGSGTVFDLALDPDDPSKIFAALYEGVFKSEDGGSSWSLLDVGLAQYDYATSLAIASGTSPTVYSGSFYEGVFRSEDGGETWQPAGADSSAAMVFDIAVDPSTSSTVYAATGNGLLRSTDSGASWDGPAEGLLKPLVLGVAVDPQAPHTLYASAEDHLYKSTDSGGRFLPLFISQNAGGPWTFALSPTESGVAYAGLTPEGTIFHTSDSGEHWSPGSKVAQSGDNLSILTAGPNAGEVYAGAYGGGLYVSADRGDTWRRLGGLRDVKAIAVSAHAPQVLVVGTNGNGIFLVQPGTESCGGDCSGDGTISIDELVLAVQIALGAEPIGRCPAASESGSAVSIATIIGAIDRALQGPCR